MHGYPPQRGRLTLPSLSKFCLTKTEWEGTTIVRRAQSIFCPSVGDSTSVLSLSRTYTTSQRGQSRAKKNPTAIAPSLLSLLTSSYYLTLSLFVFAILSCIILSQGFTDAITFFPLIMSSGCLETPCDKSVASTFVIQKAQGLFQKNKTSKAVWLAASSAATSQPQSTLISNTTVPHGSVCILGYLDC